MLLKQLYTSLIYSIIFLIANRACAQQFNEILCRPTDHSVTVSVLFDHPVEFRIDYGLEPTNLNHSTSLIHGISGNPEAAELAQLQPDTRYYYRTAYSMQGTGTFKYGPVHSFHTQRSAGSTFSFTIEADVHLYDKKGCENLYAICLQNQSLDSPDFMIDLGDTYGDDHHPELMTSGMSDSLHRVYRPILGKICHSVPFYFCLGNHEGEFDYYLAQDPPNNMAIWGTLWRKLYFPNPYPDGFYTGNTDIEPYGIGNPENYYAWTWGDALFVVMDVYRDQCDSSAKPKNWDWSIGYPQYNWLRQTLENSQSKYKFVFAHHTRGQGRGGVITAPYYEWGGYEGNGTTWGFDSKRPGWGKPIHQLFVDNGVTIFFQGHDHLFSREDLDGVIYQEVPMPSDSTYEIGMLANADAYVSDTLDGSGHLCVTVSPSCVNVEYVRAYLPNDTVSGLHHNRELAFSYQIGECPPFSTEEITRITGLETYPNPADDHLSIRDPNKEAHTEYSLVDLFGNTLLQTHTAILQLNTIPAGVYLLRARSEAGESFKKVVISH